MPPDVVGQQLAAAQGMFERLEQQRAHIEQQQNLQQLSCSGGAKQSTSTTTTATIPQLTSASLRQMAGIQMGDEDGRYSNGG